MQIGIRVRFILALLYVTFISVMFFLPGSAFPKETWLSKIYFDKWVHIGFFLVLLLLWLWALLPSRLGTYWLLAIAAVYGISVEIVQDQFVSNRSFDLGDWVADMTGALVAVWLWGRYRKNRPL
jgi:VanZ family protein